MTGKASAERLSVLHQNSGGIGKSIPSALKIGRMRWICLFSLVLVEHGYIQGILGMELSVQLKTVIDWPKGKDDWNKFTSAALSLWQEQRQTSKLLVLTMVFPFLKLC